MLTTQVVLQAYIVRAIRGREPGGGNGAGHHHYKLAHNKHHYTKYTTIMTTILRTWCQSGGLSRGFREHGTRFMGTTTTWATTSSGYHHARMASSSYSHAPPQHTTMVGRRSLASLRRLRRKRPKIEKAINASIGHNLPSTNNTNGGAGAAAAGSGLSTPFAYSGDSVEEYSDKATLSPWTPVPDSVARRMFDNANVQEDDVHVELGSGDGRVNFHALQFGVKESIGIDVDEDIVQVAKDRLARIHPPPNLSFLVSDLMDPHSVAWDHVSRATILTMYFATPGLEQIRTFLEQALIGRRCKIFTCGYPMPGWNSQLVETVLDIPIHFYDWGNPAVEDTFFIDNVVVGSSSHNSTGMESSSSSSLQDVGMNAAGMDKFLKAKDSTFRPDPLKGYHPDDLIDNIWDDFNDNEEEEKEVEDGSTQKGV